MKKMSKEEIIRLVVLGIQADKHRQSMQRIATTVCLNLNIVPYESELAECISEASHLNNYESIVRWLLRYHEDCSENGPISEQQCADELEKHIISKLPPYDLGVLYE
ncbi:MAG: hypothetical protein DRR06_08565 [Gammaproteobacteria bacterium]|nr:MAG: hypothetical protein DRR06_08565 [Gammaproteobacteria bacterium]RLA50606.1 MAG: hypothetical protein DRR42_12635 [Gammaproteobacteria bacterium]